MSGKKGNVRRSSGIMSGLVIVSTGLIAGYYGLELAMSPGNAGSETAKALQGMDRRLGDLNNLVTASLGSDRPTVSSRQLSRDDRAARAAAYQPVVAPTRKPRQHTLKIDQPLLSVNRALKAPKNQRQVYLTPEDEDLIERELQRERQLGSAGGLDRGALLALADQASADYSTEEPEASVEANPAAAPSKNMVSDPIGLLAKTVIPVVEPAPEVKSIAKPVAKLAAVQQPVKTIAAAEPETDIPLSDVPYADSADVAMFAADMPLPGKLSSYRQTAANVPLAARSGLYQGSPLVPRKFSSGKAFGGLGEQEFQKRERRCMVTALYFEARSEPDAGQVAVGQVIMNRVRSPDYPDTICGVVYQGSHRRTGCQFSFTCDGKADRPTSASQWERSKVIASKVLEGQVWLKDIGHSTHYHATYVKPRWRRSMARLKKIGRHIFYKSPNVSVTDTYQAVRGSRS